MTRFGPLRSTIGWCAVLIFVYQNKEENPRRAGWSISGPTGKPEVSEEEFIYDSGQAGDIAAP